MYAPLVPKDDGAEARPVDPAVPLAGVAFADGSPVETAVPMVPDGKGYGPWVG